ncbi:MAG: hypothetical protein L0Y72_17675 [Gemmataceae bacterium]|nr:hypothetical protein [Gemmataceae bacterium]MCI0740882.1 hypothetical protein [Gemmataceae bacterium]
MQIAILSAALLFVPPPVQERPEFPSGPQPIFAVVSGVEPAAGTIQVRRLEAVQVAVNVPESVNVNGQAITVMRTVHRQESRMVEVVYALEKTQAQTAGGKKLTKEEVGKQLKAGSVVLISADGRPVDPVYLRAIQTDTVVLVTGPSVTQPLQPPPPKALVPPLIELRK